MADVSRRTALTAGAGLVGAVALGAGIALARASPAPAPASTEPPVAPLSPGMLVGARVRRAGSTLAADFAWGQTQWGTLQVTRDYIAGTVPAIYHASRFPVTCTVVLSFKTSNGLRAGFVNSLGTRHTVFSHEPERLSVYGRSAAGGATFKADLKAFQAKMRAFDPTVLVGHAASGYAYRASSPGTDGAFISGSSADYYTFDAFRAGTDYGPNAVIPLQDRKEFQTWYSFVRATGKPWGITEFGAGRCNEPGLVPDVESLRVSATQSSVDWCRTNGAFCFSYFLSDVGPDGHNWMPTDAAFQTMYRGLIRG